MDAHTLAHSRISYAQFFGAASSVSYFLALALSLVQSSQLKKTHRISAARFPACTEICFQTFKQNCSKSIGAWRIKMLHIRPENMCIAETFRHVKMSVPPNSRSFHAVGGPFTLIQADSRSDSRAQKLCKHVEQRNHGNHFLFYLRVTTKIKFGLAGR